MPLKDVWVNKINDKSDILAEDINDIAKAVIENEENIGNLNPFAFSFTDTTKEGWVKFAEIKNISEGDSCNVILNIARSNSTVDSDNVILEICADGYVGGGGIRIKFRQLAGIIRNNSFKYVLSDDGSLAEFYLHKIYPETNIRANAEVIAEKEYIKFFSDDYNSLVSELKEGIEVDYIKVAEAEKATKDDAGNIIRKIYATKEELKDKQENLTEEQLANIDAVPNKADKTEVSNAVKEKVQGTRVLIKDISPLTDKLNVKVTGEYTTNTPVYVISATDNIWDEEWYYDEENVRVTSTNYIPATPNTKYLFYCSSNVDETLYTLFQIYLFNENKEEISLTGFENKSIVTTPANCKYIKFGLSMPYGRTYNNDVYIAPLNEVAHYPNADGEVSVTDFDKSFVDIFVEDEGVSLECEYNKDINAVIGNIEELLGGI